MFRSLASSIRFLIHNRRDRWKRQWKNSGEDRVRWISTSSYRACRCVSTVNFGVCATCSNMLKLMEHNVLSKLTPDACNTTVRRGCVASRNWHAPSPALPSHTEIKKKCLPPNSSYFRNGYSKPDKKKGEMHCRF